MKSSPLQLRICCFWVWAAQFTQHPRSYSVPPFFVALVQAQRVEQ